MILIGFVIPLGVLPTKWGDEMMVVNFPLWKTNMEAKHERLEDDFRFERPRTGDPAVKKQDILLTSQL